MKKDPGLYEYTAWNTRPKIEWPNNAKVAFWVAPNIEFYELDPPVNPQQRSWQRPMPDVQGYSHRDYGNRVGVWRLFDVMDKWNVRGSVSLNVAVCQHHPEIIAACVERNWELFSHGVYNTRYTYGMTEAQERVLIQDVIDTIQDASGTRVAGWLSPALTNTERTLDLLAEFGVKYTCDLFHDDQPRRVNVKSGRLISVPYSLEMNDVIVYQMLQASASDYTQMLKDQFDQLYLDGHTSGTVMCIPLHPYLVGQPHRIEEFSKALEYITSHKDVWVTTGREIAEYYYDNYYDPTV